MRHEKLECYQELLRITQEAGQAMSLWPRGYGYLTDQLKRALCSSVLNLVEGNGRCGSAIERRRFFEISRGSISEASACLDVAAGFALIKAQAHQTMKQSFAKAYHQIGRLPVS